MRGEDRYRGCLFGLACGDAVGTTVEFKRRGSFEPVTDMVGGGPFGLEPGQWTDDTSMALCLAESLIERDGFDAEDQIRRYVSWWKQGYLSSTGECFDIGIATRGALEQYTEDGNPFAGSTRSDRAGNGSLMRLAPVAMRYANDAQALDRFAADSSRTTHGATEAVECCVLFARMLAAALAGASREATLSDRADGLTAPSVRTVAKGHYVRKTEAQIVGSGYCIASLEAALWAFATTESFESAVLAAVNLGDDADTTAAITGQIAGAFYGVDAIPARWREKISMRDRIDDLARRLYASAFRS